MPPTALEAAPMAEGGAWLRRKDGLPVYVTHPEHVRRLIAEGWLLTSDPRVPGGGSDAPVQAALDEAAALRAENERLRMERERFEQELMAIREKMEADTAPPPASKRR